MGRPVWELNTNNMNLIVEDTPIWYDPGRGPKIAFTLTYSNENSNTGIFGPGWRCPYDMRVFFLPYGSLQVHRDTGRIETYEPDGQGGYKPREGMEQYGYRDTIEKLGDGTVVLTLRGGGKYYFVEEGQTAEGRIWKIENNVGKQVTCEYDGNGCLSKVKDANGQETIITTTGTGLDERVTLVELPDDRHAHFAYNTAGELTSITDMGDYTSTLSYGSLQWEEEEYGPATILNQNITTSDPPNGGDLLVGNNEDFPHSGAIKVTNSQQQTEIMTYAGLGEDQQQGDKFIGIKRGGSPINASSGDPVELESAPYLNEIITPSGKTKFEYEWWTYFGFYVAVVGLHEIYECGPSQGYPGVPTRHYAWCSHSTHGAYTALTRYPTTVGTGGGCDVDWTGGLTKWHYAGLDDALGQVKDELGNAVTTYEYDGDTRDRTGSTDGNGKKTVSTFDDDHNVLTRTDPLGNTWTYTYENNRVKTITSPQGKLVKKYFYNTAGQITEIQTEGDKALVQNFYDSEGRLSYTLDGENKRTDYNYDEGSETRGFLTSIVEPGMDSETEAIRYTYDDEGRRDSVTDQNGEKTLYVYDDLDRMTMVIYPDDTPLDPNDNPFVEYHYTCCHLDWEKDENGLETHYVYDGKDRLSQVVKKKNQQTIATVATYTYDSVILDRVNSITDAENHVTYYEYYDNGAVKKITYPDSTWEQYSYDDAGNMTTKSDSEGNTTTYVYDANNRVIQVCGE